MQINIPKIISLAFKKKKPLKIKEREENMECTTHVLVMAPKIGQVISITG